VFLVPAYDGTPDAANHSVRDGREMHMTSSCTPMPEADGARAFSTPRVARGAHVVSTLETAT
jgi:hypothetical protein